VKGPLPKEAQVPDEVFSQLCVHFDVDRTPVDPDVWSGMSKEQRRLHLKENRVPTWAVAVVKASPDNLGKILHGEIQSGNAREFLPKSGPKVNVGKTAEATMAWTAVRSKFPDVPVLKNPSTSREKAIRSELDALVKKFGPQPCFPKLRGVSRGRSPAGARSSGTRATTPRGGDAVAELIAAVVTKVLSKALG